MRKRIYIGAVVVALATIVLLLRCGGPDNPPPDSGGGKTEGPKMLIASIGTVYPHDTASFTEGLLFYKDQLYESVGDYGKSKLLRVDLATGKALQSVDLDKQYFGEGIVILNDTIYQLTYREHVGFMYSVKDFKKLGQFKFASDEGWGMTTDGKEIIASDGTSNLYYYKPGTFTFLRTQSVTEAGNLAFNLNELEYIDGFIYANQWQQPYILKIDPASGAIVAKADLSELWSKVRAKDPAAEVPNGIAYNPTTKKMYVTGKRWPELYEIELSK